MDLVSSTIFLHSRPPLTTACLFFYTHYTSSSNSSLRHLRGLTPLPVPSIAAVAICFGVRWFCNPLTLPYHSTCSSFINFTISAPYSMSFISLFVITLQRSPFFLRVHTFSLQSSVQIFWACSSLPWCLSRRLNRYVSMGRIMVLYSFDLVFPDIFDVKCLMYATFARLALITLAWTSVHIFFFFSTVYNSFQVSESKGTSEFKIRRQISGNRKSLLGNGFNKSQN
jgi:hypothetical protein